MDSTTATTNPPVAPAAPGAGVPQPDGLGLAPGRWELDTNHSSVGFAIRHLAGETERPPRRRGGGAMVRWWLIMNSA